jgi:dihydroxy-acid dehydratase
MLFRNLLAMEVEELIRAQPMDAVVLVGGCDKTLPGLLLGAISADKPTIALAAGPMITGSWRGQDIGACTDCRALWLKHRAGEIDDAALAESRDRLAPTGGTCMVMGTASTMAFVTEALGLSMVGTATAPAPSADRLRAGALTGRRAVALAREDLRPSAILTSASIANAVVTAVGIGGSTNAVIHISAIARRAGLPIELDDVADLSARTPLVVDCKPAGRRYLPDLHAAGGSAAVLKVLAPLLNLGANTVHGATLGEVLAPLPELASWQEVVFSLDRPLGPPGGLTVLRGTLAPRGALLKRSAATAALLRHTGPAVVFESVDDLTARIDDPQLVTTAEHVIVLRNCGPVGAGMPEAGSAAIPRHLARAGVRDMVRVSDARMSGTASGTVVLHVTPEAAVGGPLALVRDGDLIELDTLGGRLDLLVDDAELERRRRQWRAPAVPSRGWRHLYARHVLPADQGADLDFLGPSGEV